MLQCRNGYSANSWDYLVLKLRRVREEYRHEVLRVAIALGSIGSICHAADLLHVLLRQLDVQRAEILLEILFAPTISKLKPRLTARNTYLDLGRTGDRNDIVSLSEQPSECDLPSSRVVLLANLLKTDCELENVGEVLLRIPRDLPAEVVLGEVFRPFL